jgi:type IV pilus assembly protein PilP
MSERSDRRGAEMIRTRAILAIVTGVLALAVTGCWNEEPAGAPQVADFMAERQKIASTAPKARPSTTASAAAAGTQAVTEEGEEMAYASGEQDYFYDPRNKRDPFRSFRFMDEEDDHEQDFGPLADFELGQLELSAVVWDANNPRALILDPGGRSYIVREGSLIGKNQGQVIHIGDNLVLVKETYENLAGEKTTKDVELRIRLSQGG